MIFRTTIKNHVQHKSHLLKLIESIPQISSDSSNSEYISKSDWYLNSNYPRAYWRDFYHLLLGPWLKIMNSKYGHKEFETKIANYWFQQYQKDNHHNWHVHSNCHFSSVYYLELPNKSLTTQFKHHKTISVKEGDILTFPAHLIHKSPINNSEKRKTVIAFNSNIGTLK